ncbi:MAG: deoxyribonuclease IV [Bacilli bacterium]
MIIGSNVSFSKKQLLGSVKETLGYNANTFMFYTGAPQNTFRSALNLEYTNMAKKLMKENNIDIENVICHAPYIINLANREKLDSWNFSINFLRGEIDRCETIGIKFIVVHPGNALTINRDIALKNISDAINYILNEYDDIMILLETMAGKGTECGKNINELKAIIDNVTLKDKVGVCLDTCHLNDSGVNLEYFDDYLLEFDKYIGINKIKCMHINDSKNETGTKKDRHANFGYGTIGFNTLINILYNPKLKDVPKILETPFVGDFPPYKFELEMINSKIFNKNLESDIINYYKNAANLLK